MPEIEKLIDPVLIEKALSGFKSPEEADLFIKALEEYVGIGKSKIEDDLRSIDYIEKPVDMYTFLKEPYYLGIIDTVYPRLVDDLIEFFDPGNEYFLGLFGGSIGWGKSTFSEIAIARIIYEVSCLKNPQKTYRMVKEDKLFFANVSVTHTQAKRVIFEGLKGKIKGSEYFRTVFPYQDFATELRFPNNVLLAACTQSQVIGMNTFAAAMDEANFMPIVERSQTARLRGGKRLYDQAEVVFTALLRRMETRYLRFGNLPGKLMALSSAQYPDDFMERKVALYQGHKNVFVRNYAVWDTKPEGTYSEEKFIIFFNRESGLGRIPKDDEALGEEEEKIDVPVEFKHDFEIDMEGSLRDLAGKATVAIEPFITKRDMIAKMYEDNRRHPFSAYETTLRDGAYVLRDVLCQWVKEVDELGVVKFEGLRPKVNPKTRRYVHIDPSISGDAAGFCMGHPSHYEERTRWRTIQIIEPGTLEPKTRREAFVEMLPVIYVDLWLRIVPPPAGEIILGDIRQLLFELKEMGFRFALVTMDSFQSKDTQQQLKDKGMNVEELSVDVNTQPYSRLKMALYETRLKGYLHPVGVNELRQLEWNKRKGKVDHRPSGSKDMADSLAGVVHNCETKKVVEPVAPSLGIAESPADEEIKRKLQETKWLLEK